MIRKNPEKRLKWMKFWTAYGMIIPIPVVCIALVPNIKFRNEWDFYIGLLLLIVVLVHAIYYHTKEFLLIRDIDFTNQITKTKKQLMQLKEMRLKGTKNGFLFLLIGVFSIGLMGQLPIMTIRFFKVTIFIFFISIVTNYIHSKRFKKQLSSFNAELNEIEQLEKE